MVSHCSMSPLFLFAHGVFRWKKTNCPVQLFLSCTRWFHQTRERPHASTLTTRIHLPLSHDSVWVWGFSHFTLVQKRLLQFGFWKTRIWGDMAALYSLLLLFRFSGTPSGTPRTNLTLQKPPRNKSKILKIWNKQKINPPMERKVVLQRILIPNFS